MNQRTDRKSNLQTTNEVRKIAAIRARWHADIVDRAHNAFVDAVPRYGLSTDQVLSVDVPGAFEIPLTAQRLIRAGGVDAVVAFAFVVDGGIYRHDFVAATVIDGLMRVQLDEGVPVLSVVLTPHRFHDQAEHHAFFSDHFVIKGQEAAAALGTLFNPGASAAAA